MGLNLDKLVNAVAADPRHFAVPAVYAPANLSGFSLDGVFDEAYEDLKLSSDGAEITTARPVLGVRLSAFPSGVTPKQGDQVTIAGLLYNVADARFDGLGWALLMLNLAP